MGVMPTRVIPLHYVTVDFRLRSEGDADGAIETTGQHRFLYGVDSWIDGVDQRLANLEEGESLVLFLEPGSAGPVLWRLTGGKEVSKESERLALEVRVVRVVKAEAREVVRALAASVKCCDHCGGH
jgi:hypothetical protein